MWFVNWFHLQLLVFELLLCLHLPRRKNFWVRLLPCTALYLLLPAIVPGSFHASFLRIGWFTTGFLIFFLLSGLLIGFCFQLKVRQVVFFCCVSHTMQHMVHCLYSVTALLLPEPAWLTQLLQLVYMLLAALLLYRFFLSGSRNVRWFDEKNRYLLVFAVISTLIVYFFSYWATTFEGDSYGVYVFDFFTCMLLLQILLDTFQIRKAEQEQVLLERLLQQEQAQHRMSKASIDVINRKCHDLRHQIAALRHMSDEEKNRSIAELEEAVLLYDRFPKTGNGDVDLILAEKSMIAERQHIVIRSVVDGRQLAMLQTEDLYSLLGNALDNAIESAGNERNEARRVITLYVSRQKDMLLIHMENPCETEPRFVNGLPVTTKADTDNHGFGVRSMSYLCEKYHGVMTNSWSDGIYHLDILLPCAAAA